MPQLEAALYPYLTSDPAISALVGDRVFPNLAPEGTILPAVSYRRITTQRTYTYDQFPITRAWVWARVQFDSWATTAQAAMEIGEAIMLALSGYHGDMEGVRIGAVMSIIESDRYDEPRKLHFRSQDFSFTFEDAIVVAS